MPITSDELREAYMKAGVIHYPKYDIKIDGVKIGPVDWVQEYKNIGPLDTKFAADGTCTVEIDAFGDFGELSEWLESGSEDVTEPIIAIGSGTTENGGKTHGEFHAQWREGYLESLPDGPVELASTVSAGVEYRFSVCRVGDVADKEV